MLKKTQSGFVAFAVVILVALAVGGGAAYYFYTQVQNLETTPKPTGLKEEKNTPTTSTEESMEKEEEEVQEEVTSLKAVGGYSGSGKATRIFEDGKFTHSVTALLDDPSEGKFYEGWLVTNDPELDFFSTGKMVKSGSNYTLSFEADSDKSDYNQVVVTEETEENGLDGIPETHILEGEF